MDEPDEEEEKVASGTEEEKQIEPAKIENTPEKEGEVELENEGEKLEDF